MRPLRRDYFLDRRVAGEAIDRAVEIHVERDQTRQRSLPAHGTTGLQRGLELRTPGGVDPDASGREPGRQRVDCTAHFVELPDAFGIQLRDLKASAAAFGDQALPMQEMQRMGDRLARYTKLFGELVLADAMPGRQRAVDNGPQDPGVGLINQVGERL